MDTPIPQVPCTERHPTAPPALRRTVQTMKTRSILGFPTAFVITVLGLALSSVTNYWGFAHAQHAHGLMRLVSAVAMTSPAWWLIIMILWVVLIDSRHRWPHASTPQRLRAVMSFDSPPSRDPK